MPKGTKPAGEHMLGERDASAEVEETDLKKGELRRGGKRIEE